MKKYNKYRILKRTLGTGEILFSLQKRFFGIWSFFNEYYNPEGLPQRVNYKTLTGAEEYIINYIKENKIKERREIINVL